MSKTRLNLDSVWRYLLMHPEGVKAQDLERFYGRASDDILMVMEDNHYLTSEEKICGEVYVFAFRKGE